MILSVIAERLKRRSKDDFKGRHFEASLILQAVAWYLRYPLSYRDIEELFRERGLVADHATLNRWVLAYAPLIERRLRSFRKPHCGSIRIGGRIMPHGRDPDAGILASQDWLAAAPYAAPAALHRPIGSLS